MKTEKEFKLLERQNNRLKRELAKAMKSVGRLRVKIELLDFSAARIDGNVRAALNRADNTHQEDS